ncbi:hypothetical protein [Spiroplasma citri]|uniref:hypothetical protein n=1 Tax=Spiroplasma citri TaxID=2133 RepID=UPI0011BB4C2D|nr:hypothetical protein [Spiroplasma citri]QED24258.1 hypothetical protein FRX96_01840 [Spiroplasma citri]
MGVFTCYGCFDKHDIYSEWHIITEKSTNKGAVVCHPCFDFKYSKYPEWKEKDNNVKYKDDALKTENNALKKELAELKQQILYKEDFDAQYYCSYHGHWDQCIVEDEEEPTEEQLSKYILILKDNSKYDKLPSKED